MVAAMYMVPVLRDDCDSIVLVQAMLPSAERKLQAGELHWIWSSPACLI